MRVLSIIRYKQYGDAFGTFLRSRGIEERPLYVFHKRPKDKFSSKRKVFLDEIKAYIKLLLHICIMRNKSVYCTSAQYSVMTIFRLFGWLLGEKARLYIYNFYLHGLANNIRVKRIIRWMIHNDRLTIICQSPHEVDYYRELDPCGRENICFVPYCSDFFPNNEPLKMKGLSNYMFTGGYSNRDYQLVAQLAKRHQEKQFVIVASKLNNNVDNLPQNIRLFMDIPYDDFENLLSHADAVICPLMEDVGSSGQMLCISAMRNKKPIIYTDVSAINYYFTESTGYPYKMGDIESFDEAFRELISNSKEAHQRGENAYLKSLDYTKEKGFESILRIMIEEI